jgi:hypothetical protein
VPQCPIPYGWRAGVQRLAEACPGQSAGTWDLLRTVLDEGLQSIDLRLHELGPLQSDSLFSDFGHFPFGVNKEVVGIHILLNRLLFGCDIVRKMLPRDSLVKATSAALRF